MVEIGARLFAEKPFNDVWIEAVAAEAGVSRGLVYHYFPSKRDFFSAIVRHGMRDTFDMTAPDPETPPERWISEGLERLLDYVEQNADAFRAVCSGRHSVDEGVRAALREGREAQISRICETVLPGKEAPESLQIAIEAWIAMLDVLMLEWLDGRGIDRSQVVAAASGSLAGTVAASLIASGEGERLVDLMRLLPDTFRVQ